MHPGETWSSTFPPALGENCMPVDIWTCLLPVGYGTEGEVLATTGMASSGLNLVRPAVFSGRAQGEKNRRRKVMMNSADLRAVVRVGGGRGFIVAGKVDRYVITAAHCLPSFPPCASFSPLQERTYKSLIGRLGADLTVWAECLFADPIGDIAVLGPPDNQEMSEQHTAYGELLDMAVPFAVSNPPSEVMGCLLSLAQQWFECKLRRLPDGPLWIVDAEESIMPGMSGSPILAPDGSAIGVVSVADGSPERWTGRAAQIPCSHVTRRHGSCRR